MSKRLLFASAALAMILTGCSAKTKPETAKPKTKETEMATQAEGDTYIPTMQKLTETTIDAAQSTDPSVSGVLPPDELETELITEEPLEDFADREFYGEPLSGDVLWDEEDTEEDEDIDIPDGYASTVKLGDYKHLTYDPAAPAEVTDEAVQAAIDEALATHPNLPQYQTTGTVQDGDYVKVTFVGYINDVRNDNLVGVDVETQIGSENLAAEFENQLVGMNIGDESYIHVFYPADYWVSEMAGRNIKYHVKVTARAAAPEETTLNDTWVKENTGFTTVAEYKVGLRKYLTDMAVQNAKERDMYNLIDALISQSTFDISNDDLTKATKQEIAAYEQEAYNYDMTYNEYVQQTFGYTDINDFEKSLEEAATDNLKYGLVISALIEKENLDVSDAAYQSFMEEQAQIHGYTDAQAYEDAMLDASMDYYSQSIFEDMIVGQYLIDVNA